MESIIIDTLTQQHVHNKILIHKRYKEKVAAVLAKGEYTLYLLYLL